MTKEEVSTYVAIGFCQPKFYKRHVWLKAKKLMDEVVCPSGLANPHDIGFGKGKYASTMPMAEVIQNVIVILSARNLIKVHG